MYAFLCHQWGDELRQAAAGELPLELIRTILLGISLLTLVLTNFLRKLVLAGTLPQPGAVPAKPAAHSNRPAFLEKYTTATIVSLALSESIGLYGLVLFLLGDTLQTLYMFIGISAFAMLLYRPKREDVARAAVM